jgi:hypothetical protein
MTRNDDLIGLLEGYLDEYEGNTPLPNEVRDAIRAELPLIRQRPAWWPGWRFPEMNAIAKLGLAAAVVVVAALLGFNYLVGSNVGSPGLDNPSPTPTASPVPAFSGQGRLPPGRYQADPALPMDVTIEVPSGWSAGDSWVLRGPNGVEAPNGMAIRFYPVENIYRDPLVPGDGLLDPPVGPSADDLVTALVDHPDWNVTGTDPVTMDGYAGQVVHVTLPEETGEGTEFYLFRDPNGGQVYGWDADQIFDIYIVDVAGERLVIDAFHFSGTSESDLEAQQAILESIQIEAAP